MSKKDMLTEKQKLFALEYLKDLNATRAYKEVYKSCKKTNSARKAGSRLLCNLKVQNYLKEQIKDIKSEKIINVTEILEYLTKVLRGESESEIVVIEGAGNGFSKTKKIKKSPNEKERLKAAELLGRRYGMFTDNFKENGNVTINFINDLEEDNGDEL